MQVNEPRMNDDKIQDWFFSNACQSFRVGIQSMLLLIIILECIGIVQTVVKHKEISARMLKGYTQQMNS